MTDIPREGRETVWRWHRDSAPAGVVAEVVIDWRLSTCVLPCFIAVIDGEQIGAYVNSMQAKSVLQGEIVRRYKAHLKSQGYKFHKSNGQWAIAYSPYTGKSYKRAEDYY